MKNIQYCIKLSLTTLFLLLIGLSRVLAEETIVDNTMATFVTANDIPGAAVIIYTEGKSSHYYYGNMQAKTRFNTAALSELFTCLQLAAELDAVKVKLDDSITQYVSTLPASYEDITLGNLATHTSGLSSAATQAAPLHPPEEAWQYSASGVKLLQQALHSRHVATLFPAAWATQASTAQLQQLLASAIGLPGTSDTILYPMRMAQSEYIRLSDRKQGLGWQIHSLRADRLGALLAAPLQQKVGPEHIISVYDKPVFNGATLIDYVGFTNNTAIYIAAMPNLKSGLIVLANRRVSHAAIVNAARTILFDLNHLYPEAVVNEKV